jgi:alpha-glucosidase
MPEPWWKTGVVYQIYPRSFADASGDGVGDLEGIRGHLDHVAGLGADAIWLSPFYPSPMADFGYDVSDYCDVDPIFGTLADFDALVTDAHARGLRVVIDWVPNHTSDRHPWFEASRAGRADPKRDWYVWRDPRPDGGPPNDWVAAFNLEQSAWTLDEATGQYYLHLFLPEQPDLNWRNPEVVAAMHDTLRFWLDRGVDGFRMDVIHGIVKRSDLADVGPGLAQLATEDRFDAPAVHAALRAIRTVLDGYPGDRMAVGEVFILSTARVATYYGRNDELHLAFNFPPLFAAWDSEVWRKRIDRVREELDPIDAWPTWVLSNHDVPRHRTRYGSDARARAAAVLLLTLRGTPFLYAGEELGLEDAEIPAPRTVDPGGRDGCRAPIPWTTASPHGWNGAEPWLPFAPAAGEHSVEAETGDPYAMLGLYRRLLAARRMSPALQLGSFEWIDAPDGVLGYERVDGADRRRVYVNFVDAPRVLPALDGWTVELSSAVHAPMAGGSLGADEAVVLRPAG